MYGRGRYGRPGDFARKKQKRGRTPASMLSREEKAAFLYRYLQHIGQHIDLTPQDLERKFHEGSLDEDGLSAHWSAFCKEFNRQGIQPGGYRDRTSEPCMSPAESYIDECIRQASSFRARVQRQNEWPEEGQQISNRGEAPGSYPFYREGSQTYGDSPSHRGGYVPSGTPRGMLHVGNIGATVDSGGHVCRNNTSSRDLASSLGEGSVPAFSIGDANQYFTQESPSLGDFPGSYSRDRIAPGSYGGHTLTANGQFGPQEPVMPVRPEIQAGSRLQMDSQMRSPMVLSGGRQIVGRSQDQRKQLDKGAIQFLNPREAEIGTFFINKVFLDADQMDFWKPSHLEGTCTELLSFEELVSTTDLQRAVLVNNKSLPECIDMLCYFPCDVDVTLVCPNAESTKNGTFMLCHNHKQWWEKASYSEEDKSKEQTEEKESRGCGCQDVLTINLMHPRNSSEIGCKLILLWYKEQVRIIVPSASLDKMSWTHMAQFGWFHDLSITVDWGDQDPADEAQDERKNYLSMFLSNLGLDGEDLLAPVSFRSLSPAVNFIGSLPGGSQHREKNRLGLNRAKQLLHDIQWLPNSEYKSLCQSRRIGRFMGAEIVFRTVFSNDPWRARIPENLQVVYPSCDYVKRCLEEHPDRPPAEEYGKAFGFLVRHLGQGNASLLPILCDPDLDEAILLHTNLLQRYQQVETEAGVCHYGWLMTGSHTLGFSCWGGDSKSRRDSMRRFELSVMLKPFEKDSEAGPVMYAVDLKQIGLHFASCHSYVPRSFPFCPPETPGGSAFVCSGTLVRVSRKKDYGFIENLECSETWDPTKEFGGQLPTHQVFLHVQICIDKAKREGANLPYRPSQLLQDYVPLGSVLKFVAAYALAKDISVDRDKRNEQNLRAIYLEDVTESSVIPDEEGNQDMESVASLFHSPEGHAQPQQSTCQGQDSDFAARSFEDRMRMLGVKTEEDFEECLLQRVNKKVTMDPWNYGLQDGEADLEKSWPMNPVKIANDQAWLEKHVWNKFGGKFPLLKGPHCPYMLGLEVQANKKACFKGLD